MDGYSSLLDHLSGLQLPQPEIPSMEVLSPREYSYADYMYELIIENIRAFEETLDEDHEVGMRLTSFGQSILLSVENIGYANPSLLIFHGYVNGDRATLIQHMSQLSFLLISVQKSDPAKPARRIGFAVEESDKTE